MVIKRYTFQAFTTPCEVQLFASSADHADEAAHALYRNVRRLEQSYSFFREDSEIYRINHRSTSSYPISQELFVLLELSLFYYRLTGGIFDVALAGTMKPLAASATLDQYRLSRSERLAFASSEHLLLEEDRLSFSNPLTQIDLGGIVKEYAVDQSVQILQIHGIKSALVNFGGDVASFGSFYDQPWRIGIEHPDDPQTIIAEIDLIDQSLCTSGHSKRSTRIGTETIPHVTAHSELNSKIIQASTLAPTTVDAGVWSTSLLIDPALPLPLHITLAKTCWAD